KARSVNMKRRMRESSLASTFEPSAKIDDDRFDEVSSAIDEELNCLPDMYRAAIVLRDLEGKSGKEAAAQLQIPAGTLATRLVRARAMLAKRLARRGLAVPSAVVVGLMLRDRARATMPESIVAGTIRALHLTGLGHSMTAAGISMTVAALAEGVVKTMLY